MEEQNKYNVFYSWQSDLPKETNLNGIRQCLRESANLIENEKNEIHIELDEATRNTPGSPNIPNTIFSKIDNTDIFICDTTIINEDYDGRKVPNPNVLIELGHAISSIGWERIILLYNLKFGKFPEDLPFDIDRHRVTTFKIEDKNDKSGKAYLSKVLKESIKTIIEKSPLKPSQIKKETSEERKRRMDVENLKWILESIHIPTFDLFIQELPDFIIHRIFHFELNFISIFDSSSFHLYDKKLLKLLENYKLLWEKSLSFYKHFYSIPSSKGYAFTSTAINGEKIKDADRDYQILIDVIVDLKKSFSNLLKYVRENFLEIDLKETSETAFKNYVSEVEE
jgi:hypothetical protein